jgi:CheY-like chemotaxis protein
MTEKAKTSEEKTTQKVILIVEDDETSFMLLQAYLAPWNYKLLYALNGKHAIELFLENPETSLILMDLKMPVMDGYEATRQIRAFNKSIPVIAQTAYALSGDSEKAIKAGCDDYITKPIKKEELIRKVEKWLNKL